MVAVSKKLCQMWLFLMSSFNP